MSEVLVGRAYGTVELRYEALTRGISAVEQQFNRLRQITAQPITPQVGLGPSPAGRLPSTAAPTQLDAAQTRAAFSAQRLATEQQRTAVAAQRMATEEQRTATATAQAEAAQSRAAKSALSLEQAQEKAAKGGLSLGGAIRAIPTAIQALGIGFGVQQLVSFGVESAKAALSLRETENSLKAIAPSARAYADAIATAKQQQLLFGGSLEENVQGLSGLTVTARQSGASLNQLIDLSQRLGVLSPEQGAAGARIALSEALSGNIATLSRRFEIPKTALKGIADESKSAEERLNLLSGFLDSVGVTSASVAGKVDQSALAFRRLNAELETTQLTIGGQLADSFERSATGLARIIGLINGNPRALAELRAVFSGRGGVNQEDLDKAARDLAAQQVRTQLGGQRGQFVVSQRLGGQEQFTEVARQLTDLKLAGGDAAASADRLTEAFLAGTIQGDQYRAALAQVEDRQRAGVDIEDFRARAVRLNVDADREAAAQSLADAQSKAEQASKTELLNAQLQQATDQFLRLNPNISESGVAALEAAGKLDPYIAQLAEATIKADAAASATERFNRVSAGAAAFAPPSNALPGTRARGATGRTLGDLFGGGAQQDLAGTLQKQRDLEQAQFQLAMARARTSAERIAILKREQAATTDAAEKLRIQAQIEQERNSGAKAHTSELGKQLKLNESIYDSQQKQLQASIDARQLAAQDTLDRLKENRELAAAQRVLASSRASADMKAAAQARIDLIGANRDERALKLRQAQATVGASVIGGKVYQSQPTLSGGGIPTAPREGASIGGVPGAPRVAAPPGAPGGGLTIQFVVDGAVIANAIIPDIMNAQRASLARVDAAGAGQRA